MANELTPQLEEALAGLRAVLHAHGSVLVAYSGGVDSGLLAYVAHEVLGDRALPVMAISESLGARERRAAAAFLDSHGIPFETIDTLEMQDERYRRNNPDRCYFCKNELFERLQVLAGERGFERIAYGANLDDQGDHRPGARAAARHRVVAPLVEAGLDKATIRGLAHGLGLSLWDKPAAPCLASRVPYFRHVTPEKLRQIERAENVLKDHDFPVCRVRHFDAEARIEVPREEHPRIRRAKVWEAIVVAFREAGFERVVLEAEGFRSGRLNDVLGSSGGSEAA